MKTDFSTPSIIGTAKKINGSTVVGETTSFAIVYTIPEYERHGTFNRVIYTVNDQIDKVEFRMKLMSQTAWRTEETILKPDSSVTLEANFPNSTPADQMEIWVIPKTGATSPEITITRVEACVKSISTTPGTTSVTSPVSHTESPHQEITTRTEGTTTPYGTTSSSSSPTTYTPTPSEATSPTSTSSTTSSQTTSPTTEMTSPSTTPSETSSVTTRSTTTSSTTPSRITSPTTTPYLSSSPSIPSQTSSTTTTPSEVSPTTSPSQTTTPTTTPSEVSPTTSLSQTTSPTTTPSEVSPTTTTPSEVSPTTSPSQTTSPTTTPSEVSTTTSPSQTTSPTTTPSEVSPTTTTPSEVSPTTSPSQRTSPTTTPSEVSPTTSPSQTTSPTTTPSEVSPSTFPTTTASQTSSLTTPSVLTSTTPTPNITYCRQGVMTSNNFTAYETNNVINVNASTFTGKDATTFTITYILPKEDRPGVFNSATVSVNNQVAKVEYYVKNDGGPWTLVGTLTNTKLSKPETVYFPDTPIGTEMKIEVTPTTNAKEPRISIVNIGGCVKVNVCEKSQDMVTIDNLNVTHTNNVVSQKANSFTGSDNSNFSITYLQPNAAYHVIFNTITIQVNEVLKVRFIILEGATDSEVVEKVYTIPEVPGQSIVTYLGSFQGDKLRIRVIPKENAHSPKITILSIEGCLVPKSTPSSTSTTTTTPRVTSETSTPSVSQTTPSTSSRSSTPSVSQTTPSTSSRSSTPSVSQTTPSTSSRSSTPSVSQTTPSTSSRPSTPSVSISHTLSTTSAITFPTGHTTTIPTVPFETTTLSTSRTTPSFSESSPSGSSRSHSVTSTQTTSPTISITQSTTPSVSTWFHSETPTQTTSPTISITQSTSPHVSNVTYTQSTTSTVSSSVSSSEFSTFSVSSTVSSTSGVTSTPSTPPAECVDLTQMKSYLVTADSITAHTATGTDITVNNFVIPYTGNVGGSITVSITMPTNGTLVSAKFTGDFTTATIEVVVNNVSALVKVNGNEIILPGVSKFGNVPFDEGVIKVTFNGVPSGSGSIVIDSFVVCAEHNVCNISSENVMKALRFQPAGQIFGELSNGTQIYIDHLTYITTNVVVTGSCYKCECKGHDMLECKVYNCTCPDWSEWTECSSQCGGLPGTQTRSRKGVGYPKDCISDEAKDCVSESCTTTPSPCLSTWSTWSQCVGCAQKRTRDCAKECNGTCAELNTEELRTCPECSTTFSSTTPSATTSASTTNICKDNEAMIQCSSDYIRCQRTCLAQNVQDYCIERDNQCIPRCECILGYYRNAAGVCVRDCTDCYLPDSSTPVPYGYVNESECEICTCTKEGYNCSRKPSCCEKGEWSPWSECSVSCGNGTRTRHRTLTGDCKNVPEEETGVCSEPCECEPREETCKLCRVDRVCTEDVSTCNTTTHAIVDDPREPCCKRCVKIEEPCRPVVQTTTELSFQNTTLGTCKSSSVNIMLCVGSCSDSSTSLAYKYDNGSFKMESVASSCACCKPTFISEDMPFVCTGGATLQVSVQRVGSCSCQGCA